MLQFEWIDTGGQIFSVYEQTQISEAPVVKQNNLGAMIMRNGLTNGLISYDQPRGQIFSDTISGWANQFSWSQTLWLAPHRSWCFRNISCTHRQYFAVMSKVVFKFVVLTYPFSSFDQIPSRFSGQCAVQPGGRTADWCIQVCGTGYRFYTQFFRLVLFDRNSPENSQKPFPVSVSHS